MSSVICPNNHRQVDWFVFNTEAKCACAEGVRLPERSEPEGPQGAARLGGTEVVLELARGASAPANRQ